MSLATLFGKLQEHEMKLMKLNHHEENYKKKKGIALKVSSSIQEGSDKQDSNEIDEDDDFSLFVKRFISKKQRKSKKIKFQIKGKGRRFILSFKML